MAEAQLLTVSGKEGEGQVDGCCMSLLIDKVSDV